MAERRPGPRRGGNRRGWIDANYPIQDDALGREALRPGAPGAGPRPAFDGGQIAHGPGRPPAVRKRPLRPSARVHPRFEEFDMNRQRGVKEGAEREAVARLRGPADVWAAMVLVFLMVAVVV